MRERLRAPSTIVVLLVGLAAALRFTRIGHQSFWYDETVTVGLVHRSPIAMLRGIRQVESTPPLYYLVAWVWARIFGFGEAGLRSLSALAGVATVPAVYGATAKLISRRAAVVAAALTACNPLLIWYSQEARSYALLVLLASLSLCAFAYALQDPRRERLTAWSVTSALAVATHYYAALIVVPEALWLLARHRSRRSVQLGVAGVGACGLALLPLAVSQRGHAPWIRAIPLGDRLAQIPGQFLIGTGAPAPRPLLGMATAAVVFGLVLLVSRAEAAERTGAAVAAGILGCGILLSLILVAAGIDNTITRNVIVLLVPATLVVAAGLGAPGARRLGMGWTAMLCAIGVAAAVGVAVDDQFQRPDWRALARAIGAPPAPGAVAGRAILIQRNLVELWLYAPGVAFMPASGATVDELDVIASHSPHQRDCWWGAACMLVPSVLPRALSLPGLRDSGPPLQVAQFAVLRLRFARPVRMTPAMLARALPGAEPLAGDLLFVQLPPGH